MLGTEANSSGNDCLSKEKLAHALQVVRDKIELDRKRAVVQLFATAARHRELSAHMDPAELRIFLTHECKLPARQVDAYVALNLISAEERQALTENGVSPEVILGIVTSNDDVGAEAMRLIKSGRDLQLHELLSLKQDFEHGRIARGEKRDFALINHLRRSAKKRADTHAKALMQELEEVAELAAVHVDCEQFDPFEGSAARLAKAAQATLARLEDEVEAMVNQRTSSQARRWKLALESVKRLAASEFLDDGDWDAEEERAYPSSQRRWITLQFSVVEDLFVALGYPVNTLGQNSPTQILLESGRTPLQAKVHGPLTVLELCAGGGGQSIGLHAAGFQPVALVEENDVACATLRLNEPGWNVIQADIREVDYTSLGEIDLVAGGVPCQPWSSSGAQMGEQDERNLFDAALDIVEQVKPKAVMLENVSGIMFSRNMPYRLGILARMKRLGYDVEWRTVRAIDFNLPQKRNRTVLLGLKRGLMHRFAWPEALNQRPMTVGEQLEGLMASNGWLHAREWSALARGYAPTLIGGSQKKSGRDLAQKNSRKSWYELAVNPSDVVLDAPDQSAPKCEAGRLDTYPKLSLRMAARLQGFPDHWRFANSGRGRKKGHDQAGAIPASNMTETYRQIANAFPPHVAAAMGLSIRRALVGHADSVASRLARPLHDKLRLRGTHRDVDPDFDCVPREAVPA